MKRNIDRPKPSVGRYHYSVSESQGTLITQTAGFPDSIDTDKHMHHFAYSDRMRDRDYSRFKRACKMLHPTGDDSCWTGILPATSDEKFLEFAKVSLDLESIPVYARAIYFFNVSSGYDCPVIEAITEQNIVAA